MVDDQIGCPTYAGDLAQIIIQLAKMKQYQRGLLHFAGNQQMSWATFAQQIFALAAQQDKRYRKVKVEPICSADYQSAAKRPDSSRGVCFDNSCYGSICAYHGVRWYSRLCDKYGNVGELMPDHPHQH